MEETRKGLGHYLGARVYAEAFGRKRHGEICSVYRDEKGNIEVEVAFNDGELCQRPLKSLHFSGKEPT